MRKVYYITAISLLPATGYAQAEIAPEKSWAGNVAAYYYYVPDDNIPPTITAYTDYKTLHLEARFNYEDVNSVSLFAGRNFTNDGSFNISITPMAGILVGRTDGFLPGLEFEISKSVFTLYSENEYLLSFAGKYGNFFYSWTELNASVINSFKAGLAAQTLRLYKTNFDIQRGVYAEYETGKFSFDAYYFNPFSKYDFFTAAVNYNF